MKSRHSLPKRLTYNASRWLARMASVACLRIRCSGRDYLPRTGGGLVCSNHQSVLDPVLVGLSCDRRLNYLARQSLFRFAPFRWLILWYDAIPIERDGFGLAGIKETLRRLRQGELVLVFPEGTRTADGHLGPLKPGICTLARRGGVPLVPVAIDGAFESWPRTRRWPGLAQVSIQFGPPILPTEFESLTDEQLVARLTTRLQRCHELARRQHLLLSQGFVDECR